MGLIERESIVLDRPPGMIPTRWIYDPSSPSPHGDDGFSRVWTLDILGTIDGCGNLCERAEELQPRVSCKIERTLECSASMSSSVDMEYSLRMR